MNTSGTFTSTYGSPAVGYSSPAGNADKYGKGPLESPMVRVVQESVNLGNGEFRVVTEMKPVLTPAQKRMFSVIEKNETKGVSSDTSPVSTPEEVAPESPKKTESKKAGAGKEYKFKRAALPETAPSPVSHRGLGSPVSPRGSAVFSRPDVEVEGSFTTTPVTRQPSVFKKVVATDGGKEGAQTEDLTKEVKKEEVKKEEVATETTQTEIKADKSQPRSKIKLLGVISLIAGIALAAFGFYTANALAVNCGLGMMGVGSISYLIGRRREAIHARRQYLLSQITY